MLSWLAKKLIARNMAQASEGNIAPTLRLDAENVRFRFPGDSSWATELEGKEKLEPWLRRFAEVGIQIHPDEVVLKGFPWRQTICIRGKDHLDSADGRRVYENRYVIWGRISWGKLREYEVYEDTQKSKALDSYLKEVGEQ
ncbi:MAG: nuclear transport factor 2 family protein [Solirubrobacterales bacterium]